MRSIWFLILAILILFIAVPLILVLTTAKASDFKDVFTSAVQLRTMLNTAIECVCSSTLSVLIGFIYAYAVVKSDIPFKKFFRLVPLIHLMTPPFVGGLSFILLFGRQGFVTHHILGLDVSIYGFWGLLFAQTLCFFPMAFLICEQTLGGINTNLEQAAKSMGASRTKIFWTITLPLSSTGLLSALLFIAVSVLSDFGNPLIVAGRFRVLAVEIYTQLTGWLNVGRSAVLGIVLVVPSVLLFLLQNHIMKKNALKYTTIGGKSSFNKSGNGLKNQCCSKATNIALFIFVSFITLLILAQFASVIAGSFQKLWGVNNTFTFEHFKAAFKYWGELKNSVFFALTSALIACAIAILAAYIVHRSSLPLRKTMDSLVQLPSAIPGSLLGLSLSLMANKLGLHASGILIIIAMTVAFMPFAYKSISAAYSQISPSLDDASRSLGAGQLKLLASILVPVAKDGIFSGFVYSFIRAVGTVSAVIFLVSFKTPLASVRILNLAEQAFWGKACALALMLTCVTFSKLILAIPIKYAGTIIRALKKFIRTKKQGA